ncbi:hypothetical protein WN944_027070 [Citrus x changshan-huyou]|uniref:Uncharacterized protein n=1 Tax=Citrus x changshan-huyou TaxID=2935761 RepID=A0AAP0LHS8_9ROSI
MGHELMFMIVLYCRTAQWGSVKRRSGSTSSKEPRTGLFAGVLKLSMHLEHMNAVSFQNFLFLNGWEAVKEIYEIVPARKWRAEEKQMNKIVFIVNHVMVII